MPQSAPVRKPWTPRRVLGQIALWGFTLGLLYWLLAVKIPSLVDIDQAKAALQDLSPLDIGVLTAAGGLTIVMVGWTAATVLPGIPLGKSTQASAAGQLTSVVIPAPGDLIIRFAMYRSYGFGYDRSTIAVVLAGIARYFTVVAMAIIGLAAVLVTGQGSSTELAWFLGLSTLFLVALLLLRRIIRSEAFAARLGDLLQRVASRVIRWFRRTPPEDLADSVREFSNSSRDVADGNFAAIAWSNLAWGFSCVLVLLLSCRATGLTSSELSSAKILLLTGSMLVLNSVPIPPGGLGLTETIVLSAVNLPSEEAYAAFTAALLLYRVFTWLLPLPVGAVALLVWRWQVRHGRAHVSTAT